MNTEDRAVVDEINKAVKETLKISRGMSSSLIGRVNGDVVDETGGRIGRMEAEVAELKKFKWNATVALIALLLGMLGFFLSPFFHRG